MPRHYLPRPDGDFDAWAANFAHRASDWWFDQGYDWQGLIPLDEGRERWTAAWPEHVAAKARAQAAAAEKDGARAQYESALRSLAAIIQADPAATDTDRAAMGLNVRSTGRTPAGPVTSRPLARVESTQRLTHTLRFTDESTPTKRAKPAGVIGAEVWSAVVNTGEPAPTDPKSLSFLALSTGGSTLAEFKSSDGGKTAVYMVRWVGKGGEKGPWSEVCSATVAA